MYDNFHGVGDRIFPNTGGLIFVAIYDDFIMAVNKAYKSCKK